MALDVDLDSSTIKSCAVQPDSSSIILYCSRGEGYEEKKNEQKTNKHEPATSIRNIFHSTIDAAPNQYARRHRQLHHPNDLKSARAPIYQQFKSNTSFTNHLMSLYGCYYLLI